MANCKKFKNSIQQVNTKYFSTDASGIQSDAMLAGKLRYEGQDHKKVAKWLFKINEDLELFGEDVNKFPTCEMVRKVIPQTLKPHVWLKYIGKGGKELCEEEDICELCRRISEVFDFE